jgi:RNA polymerase sigma-70 factor, ECF subfamily
VTVNQENVAMQNPGNDAPIDVAAAWAEVGARLRAFAARRVPAAEADDIVQSVMLKLLERRSDVARESVRAWLFAVTRNAVVEYYRRRPDAVGVDHLDSFAASVDDRDDAVIGSLVDCLDPMLAVLSKTDAAILRRVDLEGEAQTDIARDLGVSPSTIKSRVQRARARLRAAFDACCSITASPRDALPGDGCAKPAKCKLSFDTAKRDGG